MFLTTCQGELTSHTNLTLNEAYCSFILLNWYIDLKNYVSETLLQMTLQDTSLISVLTKDYETCRPGYEFYKD
jgi:hypothetical protein